MESKEAYRERMDRQLKEWSIKIAQLRSKAGVAESTIKAEYMKQVEVLRVRSEDARAKLEELKKSGDEAWDTLKAGMEQAASDLKNAVNSAISKFK